MNGSGTVCGVLWVIGPVDASLEPWLTALAELLPLRRVEAADLPANGIPVALVDLRDVDPTRLAALAPPTGCRVIAVVSPPFAEVTAALGDNLLLLVDATWSPALVAPCLAAVVQRFTDLQTAYDESENLLEIHQEIIKAAGETIRLKEELEERTRALRAAQDQIERSRRLTALGSLGAGLAHEINNPLTSIFGLTQIVVNTLGKESKQRELLDDVIRETKRAIDLVRQFRRVVDEQRSANSRRFQINGPVRAALDIHDGELRPGSLHVTTDLGESLPAIVGDEVEVQEAVAHLLTNASQAMAGGGELRVRTYTVEGEAVFISVSDSGPGIPPELRERVFDPFFTTRSGQKRTGLGLSVAQRIIARHHGRITVGETPGGGATFTIVLPAAPKDAHLR